MQPNQPNGQSSDPSEQVHRPTVAGAPTVPAAQQPEYRYDHELPAPEPVDKLTSGEAQLAKPKIAPKPIHDFPEPPRKGSSLRKKLFIFLGVLVVIVAAVLAGAYAWYQQELSPVTSDPDERVRVTIESGSTPAQIAEQLKIRGVIRSELAFMVYTKISGTQDILKAGAYNLQTSISTPEIVEHLVSGKQDTFRVTFLPGDTLASTRKKIMSLGFGETEVDAALNKTYNRLLFTDKPPSADLEGYIYGETYEFDSSVTVEGILSKTFDEYENVIRENDLINGFKKRGLNLYQGITMASIVMREVTNKTPNTPNDDQKQVARVFFNRLAAGMTLGSDVTYQYIADKTGVERTPTLDSPYNTRRYPGLPPGPIAVPGAGALIAVANPAVNDYLFFLSGDDDVTYFGKTEAEHQRNIVNHCAKKCLIN